MIGRVLLFIAMASLCSCSNATKEKLGIKSRGPDSSTVSERSHLIIPPIMPKELPKPIESE